MEIKINKENEKREKEEKNEGVIEGFDMPAAPWQESQGEIRNPKKVQTFDKFKSFIGSKVSSERETKETTADVHVTHGLARALWWWRQVGRGALLALSALGPLFFLPATQLVVSANKEVFIFILILAAFFAYLGRVLTEGKIRYPGHWLTLAFGVLIAAWLVASLFSVNLWGSFLGNWATYDSFASILLFSVLALLVAATFDRRDIMLAVLLFLGGLAALSVFSVLQLLGIFILPWAFAKSAAFNPVGTVNDMAALMAFGVIFAAGLMSSLELSPLLRKLLGLAVLVYLTNLVLINFLPVWIGLAFAMVILISFFSAGLSQSFKEGEAGIQLVYFRKAWLPTLILLVSLFFIFIPSPLRGTLQLPSEVNLNYRTTLNIGLATLQSGKFLTGSGPNTFWHDYNLHKPRSINDTIFWNTGFAQGAAALPGWLSTVGLAGVLAIFFLMGIFIWTGLKSAALKQSTRSIVNVTSQASFVAVSFMFVMWFLYTTNFTNMAFTFWGMGIFLASSLYFYYEAGETPARFGEVSLFTSPQKTFLLSLLVVAFMVAAVAGIYTEIERYAAESYFSKAIVANAARDNAATISNISSAVNFWSYDERYWQSLSQSIFFQLNDLLATRDLPQDTLRAQFQNITGSAIQAAQRAGSLNPQNPFNSVLSGSIYENLIPFVAGSGDFAVSNYSKAVSLDPNNPSYYVAIARTYVAQADLLQADQIAEKNALWDKAVPQLERALELKNDFAPARFLLVQIFDRQGKMAEAIRNATAIVQFGPTDVGSLFQLGFLYYKNNQLSEARQVFERAIELSSNYSNARYFLGLIYDRQGDKESAITQFAQIEVLNPDNLEVKQILANLRAKKAALFGIAPPPSQRTEAPVREGSGSPIQKLRK